MCCWDQGRRQHPIQIIFRLCCQKLLSLPSSCHLDCDLRLQSTHLTVDPRGGSPCSYSSGPSTRKPPPGGRAPRERPRVPAPCPQSVVRFCHLPSVISPRPWGSMETGNALKHTRPAGSRQLIITHGVNDLQFLNPSFLSFPLPRKTCPTRQHPRLWGPHRPPQAPPPRAASVSFVRWGEEGESLALNSLRPAHPVLASWHSRPAHQP